MMSVRGWGKAMKIAPREARVANFADPEASAVLIENLERAPNKGSIGRMIVTEVTHPDNQKYLGMTLMEAASIEDVALGRLIIGKKPTFWCHFVRWMRTEHLPRQAWDKHRANS